MESKNKVNTVIILMLAVILIFAAVQHNRVKLLEERLNSLQNNITNNMRTELSNIRYYIDHALERSQSLIDEYSVTYDGIDIAQKTVNVIMNFKLKETMGNTKIQIAASNIESDLVLGNFDAETTNGLDYIGRFSLSYMYDYIFDIYETGENGYARKLNVSDSISMFIKNEMDNRTHLSSSGHSVGTEDVSASFEISNNTFGEEGFQMEKVELVIYLGGEELYRKDVTNSSLANIEDINLYNLRVAAGEIEPLDDIQYNLDKAQMDMEGVEHGYYRIEPIPNELLIGKTVDKNPPDYKFSVEVTYINGEKVTLYGN